MAVVGGYQEPRVSGGGDDVPTLANGGTAWAEQAYLRMAGISHRVENSGHCLEPLLKDGHYMVPGRHIIPHLMNHRRNLDCSLTNGKLLETAGLKSIIENEVICCIYTYFLLSPMLLALTWGPKEAKRLPVPSKLRSMHPGWMKFIYPYIRWHQAQLELKGRGLTESSEAEFVNKMSNYYAFLDSRIGRDDVFHGTQVSQIDALMFGHIADAILHPNLAVVLPQYNNLMSFFHKMCARYFSPTDLSHILGQLDEASREGMEKCIRACNVVNGRNPVGQQLNASDLLSQCPPCEADLSALPEHTVTKKTADVFPSAIKEGESELSFSKDAIWLLAAVGMVGIGIVKRVSRIIKLRERQRNINANEK
eukprot:142148_1